MTDLFSTGEDIDFEAAAAAFPDISLDGEGDILAPSQQTKPVTQSTSGFSFDDFEAPAPRDNAIKVTGDDEVEKFKSEFPDIDLGQPQPPPTQLSYTAATYAPRPQPSAFTSTPILNQPIEDDEPQVIKDWRKKQEQEIAAREEASKQQRQEAITKAEHAIDEFYEDYTKKKERNIRDNKDSEAEYLANLSESLASGTTWERICELLDLQNSQSKTIARTGAGTTDLTRYKEILLRLKREGEKAPGAAGY